MFKLLKYTCFHFKLCEIDLTSQGRIQQVTPSRCESHITMFPQKKKWGKKNFQHTYRIELLRGRAKSICSVHLIDF